MRREQAISEISGRQSVGAVTNVRQLDNGVLIECGAAHVRLSVERAGILRVCLAPSGRFRRDRSWSVIESEMGHPDFRVTQASDKITLATDVLTAIVHRSPCRIEFRDAAGRILCGDSATGMCWDGEAISCHKRLDAADHFFGFGGKALSFNKRGTTLVNWNSDAADHDSHSDPLYQSHPIALVLNKGRAYGLFFDNTYRSWFDLGKTARDSWSFGADGGELNYYVIPGPTPADVVRNYGRLVGTMPLPPMWALGFQQCRWSYESATRVRDLAKEFRKRKIPCDAIYIDIDYMDGYRCFTWNKKTFPNPAALMTELRKKGFRTVVILDPAIKKDVGYIVYESGLAGGHFCPDAGERAYVGKVWPGDSLYPDFSRGETREWWGDLYKGLIKDGIAGFWNDMNEPADFSQPDGLAPLDLQHDNEGEPTSHREIHNVYGMQMARGTFDGVTRLRPDERPFILTRAGFAGVHRYAATWTGDNKSNWEHLKLSIPMLLSMGLSGQALVGADVGGFFNCPSPELFVRWMQLGVFYPLYRVHTCGGPEQDPWSLGKPAEKLSRAAIELRYRLLPYIYTQMRQAAREGLPLMRPILLDFPNHPMVERTGHEFMFGPNLYVAPVIEPGAAVRKIWLPEGTWYAFDPDSKKPVAAFTGESEPEQICGVLTGKQRPVEKQIAVDLSLIPMFARAGAVIPMRDVIQHVDESPLECVILEIFPGTGSGELYCDDGRTLSHENGEFGYEEYRTDSNDRMRQVEIAARAGKQEHLPREYRLRFNGVTGKPTEVRLGDTPLPQAKGKGRIHAGSWTYDAKSQVVTAYVSRWLPGHAVQIVSAGSVRKAGKQPMRKRR